MLHEKSFLKILNTCKNKEEIVLLYFKFLKFRNDFEFFNDIISQIGVYTKNPTLETINSLV